MSHSTALDGISWRNLQSTSLFFLSYFVFHKQQLAMNALCRDIRWNCITFVSTWCGRNKVSFVIHTLSLPNASNANSSLTDDSFFSNIFSEEKKMSNSLGQRGGGWSRWVGWWSHISSRTRHRNWPCLGIWTEGNIISDLTHLHCHYCFLSISLYSPLHCWILYLKYRQVRNIQNHLWVAYCSYWGNLRGEGWLLWGSILDGDGVRQHSSTNPGREY